MKILIAGDFCQRFRTIKKIEDKEFSSMFDAIKPIVNECDVKIVNFEFPIVVEKSKPIKKIGPTLKGTINAVDAIKYAGFNVCTLANNHILDQGDSCCIETKNLLEKMVCLLLVWDLISMMQETYYIWNQKGKKWQL